MTQPLRIFISYARKDGREYAEHLYSDLINRGIPAWRDTRNLDPYQDFTAELEKAIEGSSHVAVCITPDTKRDNSFVRREIGYALALKKPIIPLLFSDIVPPISIVNHTRIYFVNRPWEEAFTELVDRIHLPITQADYPDSAVDPFRDYLAKLYQEITNYLNVTVFSLVELYSQASPDAIAPQTSREDTPLLLKSFFQTAITRKKIESPKRQEEIRDFDNFASAFDHYEGRLLLLGEPGAGKTTVLMTYARDAVAKRLEDPNASLPILARISDYPADSAPPLSEWLATAAGDQLRDGIQSILTEGRALLLLDGLDELGSERPVDPNKPEGEKYDPRLRFMHLIPANNKVLVTCRVKDYEDIGEKIALKGAVKLKPLNDKQLRTYLVKQPELMAAIEADSGLREMLSTPLLLSFFAFAYHSMTETQRQQLSDLSKSPGDLRDAIFRKYVEERYKHERRKLNAKLPYSVEEMYEVLGTMALEDVIKEGGQNRILNSHILEITSEMFIRQANELHIFISVSEDVQSFIHLRLRDYFAYDMAVKALSDTTNHLRRKAPIALSWLDDSRVVDHLIMALSDEDTEIKRRAVFGLGRFDDSRVVDHLIMALGDKDSQVKSKAVIALTKIGSHSVGSLIVALNDSNKDIRAGAAQVLGKLTNRSAIVPLIRALGDPEKEVRQNAALALGEIKDSQAIKPLIRALGDPEKEVRQNAALALGNIGSKQGTRALRVMLSDPDKMVRQTAAEALRQIGNIDAVKPLIAMLGNLDPECRNIAALALGWRGNLSAVEPLTTALHDADERVRHTAAHSLMQIGVPGIKALIAELHDADSRVRVAAAIGLGHKGNARGVKPLIVALRDSDLKVRKAAVHSLIQIETPAVGALVSALNDTDDIVRLGACQALGWKGNVRAIEGLITALNDKNEAVRTKAIRALGRIGNPVIKPLIDALGSPKRLIREGAAVALARRREAAVKPLIAALNDSNIFIRRGAVRALGWNGNIQGIEPLTKCLEDTDPIVRERAIKALRHISTQKPSPPSKNGASSKTNRTKKGSRSRPNDMHKPSIS